MKLRKKLSQSISGKLNTFRLLLAGKINLNQIKFKVLNKYFKTRDYSRKSTLVTTQKSIQLKEFEEYRANHPFTISSESSHDQIIDNLPFQFVSQFVEKYQSFFPESFQPTHEISVGSSVKYATLSETGYLKSFPELTLKINAPSDVPNHKQRYLSPTVCHRIFEHLQDQQAYEFPALIKSTAVCHRNESKKSEKDIRCSEFTMTEFVAIGSEEYIAKFLILSRAAALATAKHFKINLKLQQANDPFFLEDADIVSKARYQTLVCSKIEGIGGNGNSIFSFNNHSKSMTNVFLPLFASIDNLHSACVGIGHQRLIYNISKNLQ